jgi:transcriptional regulator with XRE-family HTH domain
MTRKAPSIVPRLARLLAGLGENIRKARLRRAHSAEVVAQRAGISRKTLYRVEQGDPAVALGIYARVLQALRLESDIGLIASDDLLGRKLQDAGLERKTRAQRKLARSAAGSGQATASKSSKEPEGDP